jgi:GTP-binding protein EngB required for normal cell division
VVHDSDSVRANWREVLRQRYLDMKSREGVKRTVVHLDAEHMITSADRQMAEDQQTEYLQQLEAIKEELLTR